MSKIPMILFLMIFVIGVIFAGCAKQDRFSGEKDFQRMENRDFRGPPGDMDPERQAMFEQMQEKAKAACQDKTEGDACTTEGPRGEMQGTCNLREDVLSCMPARPEGRRMIPPGGQPPEGQRFPEDGVMPPPDLS